MKKEPDILVNILCLIVCTFIAGWWGRAMVSDYMILVKSVNPSSDGMMFAFDAVLIGGAIFAACSNVISIYTEIDKCVHTEKEVIDGSPEVH